MPIASSGTPNDDQPVFYDKTGRRWRATKICLFLITSALVALLVWIVPEVLHERQVSAQANDTTISTQPPAKLNLSSAQLASKLSHSNTAVIGKGPFARAVRVSGGLMYDVFSGESVGKLDGSTTAFLAGDDFAIQKFGETHGKRIALTFDDGPHPIYTPEILDLLSRQSVPASFFVTGDNVVKYPEIAQRIVREGHVIANHTFSHADLTMTDPFFAIQQINQTDRVIVAATGKTTSYFRPPYIGASDQSLRNSLSAILQAQQLGYTNTIYDFDSVDWKFPVGQLPTFPKFQGDDEVVLMHDGGGDRSQTVGYVGELIKRARAKGYSFVNLDSLHRGSPGLMAAMTPRIADQVSFGVAWSLLVLPTELLTGLFVFTIVAMVVVTITNLTLATIQWKLVRYPKRPPDYQPLVTVIVPAYNEQAVLARSVASLLASNYPNFEILIVDDGSNDDTWQIARELSTRNAKVEAVSQLNAGKASAINHGVLLARGEIVVGVDADTQFASNTLGKLVRHFHDPSVGAVAGVVRVGNVRGVWTFWQALEYSISIAIDRNAQARIGAVMTVPGACGAWRKSVIIEAGGLSTTTLAEDADLTMAVQQIGKYKILQDNEAISYTEAPELASSLIKQRFRWTFGSIQVLWKYRRMMGSERHRFLGVFVMPYAAISILIPLLFWPVLWLIALDNVISGNFMVILVYFLISLTLQFVVAFVGLRFSRLPLRYMAMVPFARFIYGPIRAFVLYKTVLVMLRGSLVSWNKLRRTGMVRTEKFENAASTH